MTPPLVGPDELACTVFGDALPVARRYADLLRGDGVAHGHLGPREVDRLWERHLVNSAVVTDLVAPDAHLVDVGSGAGLPGLPMAIRRPDLRVTLLEPMQKRVAFLQRCVEDLDLTDRVRVVRGRAGDPGTVAATGRSSWVTARAVAPLDRLVGWCVSLLETGGLLLALKGDRARAEVDEHQVSVAAAGMTVRSIDEVGTGDAATRVVVLERTSAQGGHDGTRRPEGR